MSQAQVIADSIAPSGVRLTTMLVTYANIIKQDLWTHRSVNKNTNLDVSRSSNSNRAIPTKKIILEVLRNPFVPERFPKRSVQMHSAQGYHTGIRAWLMRHTWLKLRYVAILCTLLLQWLGCHKQIANRLLDQWQWTTAVFTATDEWWQHFFSLRNHYAAQDQVQDIANAAWTEYHLSKPTQLAVYDWHLPFVLEIDKRTWPLEAQIKLSVARCARLSYRTSTSDAGDFTIKEDFALHDRLVTQDPEHAGPREHQAMALADPNYHSGNLRGWDQLRHSKLGADMKRAAIRELDYETVGETRVKATQL